MKAVLIMGIGNELRGDDGVGPAVVRALKQRDLSGVELRDDRGEDLGILDAWEGYRVLVLVDAVRSGARSGTIHSFDAGRIEAPAHVFGRTSHTLSVAETIALARTLEKLPPTVMLFGIEGEDFGIGRPISAAVAEAVPRAAEQIAEYVRRWTHA